MKLLITAFGPFGDNEINSSLEVLKALPSRVGNNEIYKFQVPVVFGKAGETVIAEAERIKPGSIICLGMAEGRAAVTPEYVGINSRNALFPDNEGGQPVREAIDPDGPDAYFSTLPVFDMADAIRSSGVNAEVSYSAGTFVCNDLLYTVLRHCKGTDIRAGFIHFPLLPDQAKEGQPSMSLNDMVSALTEAVKAI